MPGQSGAVVKVEGDIAYKRGVTPASAEATVAQGEWLSRQESPHLPNVFMLFEDGYAMERLNHLPIGLVSWDAVAGSVMDCLRGSVWDPDDDVTINWSSHSAYVSELTERYGYSARLIPMMREVIDLEQHGFLHATASVHGDPTFSNVMLRGGYHYDVVLIDPIPPRSELPMLQAFDAGKLLQSVFGYEAVRFGWPEPGVEACEEAVYSGLESDEEVFAAQYFAFFHVLRAMKYAGKPHVGDLSVLMRKHLDRLGR